ncbi:MAG: Ig-like domain repeat protein [Bacteroidetes bacterium]|nr:Ig-like domain repeat protein [Bacteroidota bacterium]
MLKGSILASLVMVGAFMLILSSCTKTESNKPAPTISLSSSSTSNVAGSQVSTTVTINAPEGGKTLSVTINGVADANFADGTLSGAVSKDITYNYSIPANAAVNTVYTISFQVTDNKNQQSIVSTFVVIVSAVPSKTIIDVPAGNITTDTHWTADKIYRLNGFVRVGTDAHTGPGTAPTISATATLTIDAGTVIYGKSGTPGGTLIVQRGSKIIANGTASNPIVFTSEKSAGSRKAGDWGGFVICGKSANNITTSTSTATPGIEELEGGYGGFHGGGASPDLADNSGSISYVRVEFAGYPINPNQEINGVTFGSVGSGTTFHHVQVTYANDDSFEWFGGTINADHLIAYKGIDDDFDTDNGFSGQVQFGLGIRDQGIADQSGSNGFECDNDANGSSNTPYTNATFSNMTIIGGKATSGTTINLQFQNGAQIRRNAKQDVINSFITAYPNGVYIDNALPGTIANATAGELVFKNNVLAGVEGWGGNGFGSSATADEITVLGLSAAGSNHPNAPKGRVVAGGVGSFSNGTFGTYTEAQISSQNPIVWFAANNTVKAKWSDATIGLNSNIFEPLNGAPTLLPANGSILLSGADFTGYTGFTTVAYKGAFGATDWTLGWVNWNPQISDYTK